VVLPLDEYRALRTRTLDPVIPDPPPPVDATLTRVDYELRVEGDAASGRALVTIDVLRDGWVRVQLPAGLMVRDARIDGQPVSLVEGPPPHVLLSRPGRFVLALDIVMPLASSAGTESITIPASPAPIGRVALVLPRAGVELSPVAGFIAEHVETPSESRWVAFGQPNQPLGLTWKRRVDDRRALLPLRVRTRITQFVGLGEDSSQISTSVRVEVLQGVAREIVLALPSGLVVSEINGATVGDWEAAAGTLRVRLLEPVASEASFIVQAEARLPRDGSITVPLVRMPTAEREFGGVAVDVLGAGEVAQRHTRGLEPADPSELGDIVASRESPSMVAFRLRSLAGSEDRALTVQVVRFMPQAVLVANIEEARYRALASEDGRLLVEARYAVRNNQRSFLKVTMPPRSTVWAAEVAGRPVRPGLAEEDAVLLPLDKSRAGEDAPTFVVELLYLQRIDAWPEKGRATLALPALDLPVSRTGLTLHYSPRFRVQPEPGAFRLDDDPGPSADALRRRSVSTPRTSAADKSDPFGGGRGAGAAGLQALVDRYINQSGGRSVVGSLPVNVTFPEFGPSLFFAAELTAETRAPSLDLSLRRLKD
jgi:hypothetical protein